MIGRRRGIGTERRRAAAILVAAVVVVASASTCSSPATEVERPPSGSDTVAPATVGADPGGTVACAGGDPTARRDLAYRAVEGVDPNLLSLDLYLPARPDGCGPTPVVVYVHGGGFVTGDKANRIDDKVRLFTGEGWAFASVNYRLSPDPPSDLDDPVRYPVHEQDVASAIAWIADHASEHGIDAGRILLLGHSSGAFLVSLLATDTSFLDEAGLDPAQVRCIASLDTEYDVAAQVAQGGKQEALYRNAIGDDPAVWTEASPLTHAAAPDHHPEVLVVTQGPPRRTEGSQAFADALITGGSSATVVDAGPLSHEAINTAVGASDDAVVTPPLLDLFRRCVTDP